MAKIIFVITVCSMVYHGTGILPGTAKITDHIIFQY